MTDYKIETGARMLYLRKKQGKSQADVAKHIGLTVAAYQNYETGRREAGYETLTQLADFYHVTTDYLLGREQGEPSAVEKLAGEFNMTALEKEILDGYVNLPKEMRGDLMEFLHKAVENVMNDNKSDSATCGEFEDQQNAAAEAKGGAG